MLGYDASREKSALGIRRNLGRTMNAVIPALRLDQWPTAESHSPIDAATLTSFVSVAWMHLIAD